MTQPTLPPWGIVAPVDEPARLEWKPLNPCAVALIEAAAKRAAPPLPRRVSLDLPLSPLIAQGLDVSLGAKPDPGASHG
jgi:hypothetical protein